MTDLRFNFMKIINWDAETNFTEDLVTYINVVRGVHPEFTVTELAEMTKNRYCSENKEQVLEHYPDALTCSNVWFVLFPDGTTRDVEYEIKRMKINETTEIGMLLRQIGTITTYDPNKQCVCTLASAFDVIKEKYPDIRLKDLMALRVGSAFANGEDKRVISRCSNAVGYDYTGWVILDDGIINPLSICGGL